MAAPILLCDTTGMSNDRWLECRMHGPKGDIPYTVGGSDVAAIFGVSPWTTPLELWMIKKGRISIWPLYWLRLGLSTGPTFGIPNTKALTIMYGTVVRKACSDISQRALILRTMRKTDGFPTDLFVFYGAVSRN